MRSPVARLTSTMRGCWSGTGAIAAREAPSAKAWLTGGTGIERIGDETISEGIQLVPSKASTQKLTDDLQPEPFYSSTIALMLFGLYGRPHSFRNPASLS